MKLTLPPSALVLGSLCLLALHTLAVQEPQRAPLPNFDRRQEAALLAPARALGTTPAPTATAHARLKSLVPGVKVEFDPVLGVPKLVSSTESFLTGPNGVGQGVTAAAQAYPATDAHRGVKAFLSEHNGLFGHGAGALDAARTKRDFTDPRTGLRTTVWEQQLDDISVFEAVFIAHVAKAGELVNVSSQFVPDLAAAADNGHRQRAALQRQPAISARQALVLAAKSVGDDTTAEAVTLEGDAPAGSEQRQKLRAAAVRGDADVRLVWLPMNRATLRLCWEVVFTSGSRGEMFRVLIDAASGDAVIRHCLTEYISPATYRVFTNESPTAFSPGHAVRSTNQPPLLARALVVTSAYNTNASPNGWIDDGMNETRGNNVDAHTDRDDNNVADVPRPQGSPARVFDFPIDFGQSPTNYAAGAVVQLFYYCNFMHDRLYELGFTEAAGNFQVNNFGRGGAGNDPVQADAQDGGGFNNANFSTPADGSSGRMQMYLWDGPNPDIDGDFDGEVVLHEYAHGLSNRRVGGGVGISALQSRGMGEGWSDFYGIALFAEASDDIHGNWARGGYSRWLAQGNFRENYYFGGRRYPYSTDMTKNPLTFKDIDPTQADPHTDVPRSPIVGNTADQVHNQGNVWCVTLWDVRANLITKHGFAVGNELALKLVTDGMNFSPPNPNFLQARDGIIQADAVLTGGANRNELWMAFAKRGMGFNAASPNSSTTVGVVENYDLPDDLRVTPAGGFTARGPVGGPFTPSSQIFTLLNVGTNAVAWTASGGGFVTVTPTGGNLPVGGSSITVTAAVNAAAASLTEGVYTDAITFTNLGSGRSQRRTVTLLAGLRDYFTELFTGDNDLDHTTISFTPDGSSGFYAACREPASGFPTDPAGGAALSLTDDSFDTVTLAGGAEVSLYGRRTNVFHVGSNGYITFEQGDSSLGASFATHFARPRVTGLFEDLLPAAGDVTWKQLADRAAVTFLNVREFGTSLTNSFQFELFFNGVIRLTWLNIATVSGLAGLSAGAGEPLNFSESDLSGYGPCLPALLVSLPDAASESSAPLTGRVSILQPLGAALTVNLTSSAPSEVSVPATATILAGQTNAAFAAVILDDAVLDGSQAARVTAAASGYQDGSDVITVHDNESATLSVVLPASVTEGGGLLAGAGRVNVSAAPARDVVVALIAANPSVALAPAPAFTVIPAGQTAALFNILTVNNNVLDGARAARFTAHVENWLDGSAVMTVLDNDVAAFTVSLPAEATEGDGALAGAGRVSLRSLATSNVVASLSSSDTSELIVPATVVIPAGQSNAAFTLTVVDDDLVDGPQTATVSASAPGFTGASAAISIADNEVPTPPYSPDPPHLGTNVALTSGLSWLSGEGEQIRNGGFENGDFRGWSKENAGPGDFMLNNGAFDPESPDGPLPPFAGNVSAISQQSGVGRHAIYQDVFIPSGATFAHLTFHCRVRNHAARFADNQQFRVELRALDDTVLAVLFRTQPGDALLGDWTARSFDVRPFRGQDLRVAFVEDDAFGFLNVHLDDVSLMVGAPQPSAFDVYFGTNSAPGPAEFRGSTTNTTWTLPPLTPHALYYWQVVARRGTAEAAGPVWQFRARATTTIQPFVPVGSVWKYWDRGSAPGAGWQANAFDDSAWTNGRARLGYGGDGEATTVSYGPDLNNKYTTTYFRHAFVVPDAASVAGLSARYTRDDGAVLYLNGMEVFRSNMSPPPATIGYGTFASSIVNAPEETTFYPTNIAPDFLISSTNVLAVELHQASLTSTDLGFDFELIGSVTGGSNLPPVITITNPVDYAVVRTPTNITFGAQASDPDGTIARVEFYVDGARLGEDSAPPYRLLWSGIQPGIHILTAVATDNSGSTTVSAPVTVVVQSGLGVPLTLVPYGATWRYRDLGQDLGTAWRGTNYDDSLWAEGPAQLGYGDGDEATVVDYGPDIDSKYTTTYFRLTFTNTAVFSNLTVRVIRDDGVIVYLNGVEVLRNSLPAGTVTYSTFASSTIDFALESTPIASVVSPSLVYPGKNVLAVEIHQTSLTSSDISFDLELTGTGNFPPSVALTSPGPASVFALGEPIPLAASASDPYGNIANVEFFQGASRIGQDTNAPYALTWTNAPLGVHTLVATATDTHGATNRSGNLFVAVRVPPILAASRTDDTLTLSWSSSPPGFALESATNLAAPILWSRVTNAVSQLSGQFVVSLNATNGTRFFRLAKP